MSALSQDLEFRGLVYQVTDPELPKRLDTTAMVPYTGFDPTAPSLHVGSLLQLCTLRRFQEAGHRPIALLGGGTGQIGDPGGKTEERQLLDPERIAANVTAIHGQMARFVELAPLGQDDGTRAMVLDNAQWLGSLPLLRFLRDIGKHFTVNQMMAKESVRSRLERPDQGISYTEFSYMLLQSYDFLRLHQDHGCDLQIGGSDQWGNITAGVDLVRKLAETQVWGLTSPLVTKADGTKFGKTEQGTVWLDAAMTTPYQLFQFFLQTEDAMVASYLRYFTFLDHVRIQELDAETAANPGGRAGQRTLAREVCALVHGQSEADAAETASAALFGPGLRELGESVLLQVMVDAPSTTLTRTELVGAATGQDGGISLVDALRTTGLARSASEARRQIAQGGVYVNNDRESDDDRRLGVHDLLHDRYVVLRRGRQAVHLLRAE